MGPRQKGRYRRDTDPKTSQNKPPFPKKTSNESVFSDPTQFLRRYKKALFILFLLITSGVILFMYLPRLLKNNHSFRGGSRHKINPEKPAHPTGVHESPCTSFRLISGHLDHTNHIFLGDSRNKTLSRNCIEVLTEDAGDHIVLVESVDAFVKVECETRNVNNRPGRTCLGWDVGFVAKKTDLVVFDYIRSKNIESWWRKYIKFDDNEFELALLDHRHELERQMQDNSEGINPKAYTKGRYLYLHHTTQEQDYLTARIGLDVIEELQQARKEQGYAAYFESKKACFGAIEPNQRHLIQTTSKIYNQRHRSLLDTAFSFTRGLVVSVVGSDHFTKRVNYEPELHDLVEELEERSEPHAILAVRRSRGP